MAIRAQPLTINFMCFDTLNSVPKIGQTDGLGAGGTGNLTMMIIKDGSTPAYLTSGNITEPNSGLLPGIYEYPLTSTDTDASFITVAGYSRTSNVTVYPTFIATETGYLNIISGNLSTTSGNVTNNTNYLTTVSGVLTTVSGNLVTMDNVLDTVSGVLNTVSGNITTLDSVNDTVSGLIYWIKQRTDYLPSGLIDGVSHSGVLDLVLAMSNGNFDVTGSRWSFYRRDNVTKIFEMDMSSTARTRV